MKKRSSLRWFIWLTVLVVLCGGAVYLYQRYGKNNRELKNMVIDDTLYADEIKAAAKKHGLPPELVRALIKKESRFRADQIGEAGEVGLMQILPQGAAAEWARVNKCKVPDKDELLDVKTNLEIGCWYLARAIQKWKDYRYGMELALAEYNAGAKNSARWKPEKKTDEVIHRIDFPSTRKYVTEIMHDYREYLIQAMK